MLSQRTQDGSLRTIRVRRGEETPAKSASLLKWIANAENQNGRSIDKAVVLKTLTMIENQNSRTELAGELKNTVRAYNTLSLVPQTAKFNKRMYADMSSEIF